MPDDLSALSILICPVVICV